jgi:hypothetical protein
MKLNFKVCPNPLYAGHRKWLTNLFLQDLKQVKFTIDAEPSETVGILPLQQPYGPTC